MCIVNTEIKNRLTICKITFADRNFNVISFEIKTEIMCLNLVMSLRIFITVSSG